MAEAKKPWSHPGCLLLFPSHLQRPRASSSSNRYPEPNLLSSPWQPYWSKLRSPSICKLWALLGTLCFCLRPSQHPGRAWEKWSQIVCFFAGQCASALWLKPKSWGCVIFLSFLMSLPCLMSSSCAPCSLVSSHLALLCYFSSIWTSSLSSGYLPACPPSGFKSLLRCHLGSETVTSTLCKARQPSPHPTQEFPVLLSFLFSLQPLSSVPCCRVNTYFVYSLGR